MIIRRKQREPNIDSHIDSTQPGPHTARAYARLQEVVRTSIQVPSDVVAAITGAHQSVVHTGSFADQEQETRFWNAYGLLSSIRPADTARENYKHGFYVVLFALLVFQLLYLAGTLVNNRLKTVEDEWQHIADTTAAARTDEKSPRPGPTDWARLRRGATIEANYQFAWALLHLHSASSPGVKLLQNLHKEFEPEQVEHVVKYMKLKGELEILLMALSLYVLPLLYGLLGAFAFVLRKLSDPVGKLTYAHDTRVSYTLRLHIGALSGLAVGWFINGNTPSSGLTALSPLALAFAAGFGSDLLFTALDKVISAFSPLMSSQNAAVHTEATFGGMTVTNDAQRDTRVAGGSVPVPHQADQGLKPDIEPDKRAEPALPAAGTSRSKAA